VGTEIKGLGGMGCLTAVAVAGLIRALLPAAR